MECAQQWLHSSWLEAVQGLHFRLIIEGAISDGLFSVLWLYSKAFGVFNLFSSLLVLWSAFSSSLTF